MSTPSTVDAAAPQHRLLVYGDDEEYAGAVASRAGLALTAGGAAIVYATHERIDAVRDKLQRSGLDVHTAEAEGRFPAMDVHDVVAAMERASDPVASFESSLATAVDTVRVATAPVEVFGDVSAILWQRGQAATASAVEEVSAIPARDPAVSVTCAYPDAVLLGAPNAADEIGRCHSSVLGTVPSPRQADATRWECARKFPPSQAACRAARRFVRAALAATGDPALVNDAELLTSELTTNAVRHAKSPFILTLAISPTAVRVSVADDEALPDGTVLPVAPNRGLGIVTALARHVEITPNSTGKVISATLHRGQSAPSR